MHCLHFTIYVAVCRHIKCTHMSSSNTYRSGFHRNNQPTVVFEFQSTADIPLTKTQRRRWERKLKAIRESHKTHTFQEYIEEICASSDNLKQQCMDSARHAEGVKHELHTLSSETHYATENAAPTSEKQMSDLEWAAVVRK